MQAVAADDWNLNDMTDPARRCRLLGSVSPADLLERVITQAKQAAANRNVCVHWQEARDQKLYWRVETVVPLSADTFDLLFNGRMGYRAQYYRSADDGRMFNRGLVDRLIPVIKAALQNGHRTFPVTWSQIEHSLKGPHSKAWVAGDWAAFIKEPKVLKPARWVSYWNCSRDKPLGLVAPLPSEPALDLKGTFFCQKSDEPWLPDVKKDRDKKIFCSGWT